jgi:Tfp pilus assembly protein PilO
MDKMKQWVALATLAAVAILAGGWFLVISPKRADAAALQTDAANKRVSNQQLTTQLAMLKAQAKDLPKQQAKLAAVAAKIPDSPAEPALVRALTDAADEAGVELISISPGSPTAVSAAPAATTTTAAGATTPTGAVGAASVGSLQAIAVNLNVVGGYFQVAQFLDRLENLSRAFKVSSFALAPGLNPVKKGQLQTAVDNGSSLSATIVGSVYMASGRTAYSATTGK